MKTSIPTREQQLGNKWFLIDAKDQVLGRVATRAAALLRGKHKVHFVKHMDMGDHVIIVNADKIRVTGKKMDDKIYYTHSGYNSGLKSVQYGNLVAPLVEAVKELDQEVQSSQAQIVSQQQDIEDLQIQINLLEKKIADLKKK